MDKFNNADFLSWANEKNLFYERFSLIADRIQGFVIKHVLNSVESAEEVAVRLDDVMKNCDEITYDESGAAEAYAILHFLDRYHRFQLIYKKMIELNVFPIRKILTNMDVGTGPAPALFALSDIYTLIKDYCIEKNLNSPEQIENQYVEKSQGFRNWLHHFTEYANYIEGENVFYNVPYHHGKFNDFKGIDFNREYSYWDYDDDGDQYVARSIDKTRNNLVIFSNFLTNNDTVEKFSNELYNSALFLRNKGILLVVGARSTSDKYREVYTKLDKIISEGKYTNNRFIGNCRRINLENHTMSYRYNTPEGERMKVFLKEVLSRFDELGVINQIPQAVLKMLQKAVKEEYDYEVPWEVHLYKRFSKFRHKYRLKR
ncbi:hypothetical protein KW850_31350 [Bacillus sp. sid0103]|uniref:hypothetical protein n=1 Tax=Bacillus sp. sid0103 TaxID=2856337 RepID=UPI001C48C0E8|nr:hypothetical protein [Bacillus sp. sid0103]MBV7509619.1 hypothetical protein [Bacillus sp. sid0103]